mgnify:CR=1 FL=1
MRLKEKEYRNKLKKSEISRLLYKQLYINSSVNIKRKISLKFSKKLRDTHSVALVNRCIITNRSRGVFSRKFKLARYSFRMLALRGFIPGVFK